MSKMFLKLTFGVSLVMLFACSGGSGYSVSGVLEGSSNDTLVVEEMEGRNLEIRRSVVTDANGAFSWEDTASNPRLLFLLTRDNQYITLMVTGGQDIKIKAKSGSINESLSIEGSPDSKYILDLNEEIIRTSAIIDSMGKEYEKLQGTEFERDAIERFQREFVQLKDQQRSYIRNFILEHYKSPASLMALSHKIGQQSVLNPNEDFALYEKVDSSLFKKYPESELVQSLHNFVANYRLQAMSSNESQVENLVGKMAPEIKLPTPEGKEMTLSSLRGKYVLVDFWAAWCGPCRRENPNVVEAYRKYKDKGFEIFGVSLDKKREDWVKAIADDNLNWIHVSDLSFWNTPVIVPYGVNSIPANFLLDPNGKVIAQGLRGAALEQKLAEIFR